MIQHLKATSEGSKIARNMHGKVAKMQTPPPLHYTHAIVRPPGDSFRRAISETGKSPDPIKARRQHAEYCQALQTAGLELHVLPADEHFPDSCFMQDPALVLGGHAIIGRMAASSRQGEEDGVAETLASFFPLARISSPGTLEGGDILPLPEGVFVGLTARTNQSGIDQLRDLLAPLGIPVTGVTVTRYLHLLTGTTYLGRGVFLALEDFLDDPFMQGKESIAVPLEHAHAANALGLDNYVILPVGHPKVAAEIQARGFEVLEVPLGEFAKADGGATCLSLVW
jgi:dimethylargininase